MGEVKREWVVGQSMVLQDGSKRDKVLGANLWNICRKEMTGRMLRARYAWGYVLASWFPLPRIFWVEWTDMSWVCL